MDTTWKKIEALLKDAGYTGDGSLDSVKDYVAKSVNGGKVLDTDGETVVDLDAAFKAHEDAQKKAVTLKAYEAKVEGDQNAKNARTAPAVMRLAGGEVTGGEPVADRIYNEKAKKGLTSFSSAKAARFFQADLLANSKYETVDERGAAAIKSAREFISKAATYPNSAGGALVAPEYAADLIRLTDDYGVFRKYSRMMPMNSDYLPMPKQTGFTSGQWVVEGAASTTTEPTFSIVALNAKKRLITVTVTNELLTDSSLSYTDIVARDIARDFGYAEDDAGFNGTGTSTYGNFTGLAGKFRQTVEAAGGTWATNADYNPGIVTASGNLAEEVTYTDLTKVYGKLPPYALASSAWFMSQWAFANIFVRLAGQPAASGVAWSYAEGVPTPTIFGRPVVQVQAMPQVDANSQFLAYFGDLSLASKFGMVNNSMEVRMSGESSFATDQSVIRGKERVAITVHDIGTASSTAASRVTGPMAGLLSAAS